MMISLSGLIARSTLPPLVSGPKDQMQLLQQWCCQPCILQPTVKHSAVSTGESLVHSNIILKHIFCSGHATHFLRYQSEKVVRCSTRFHPKETGDSATVRQRECKKKTQVASICATGICLRPSKFAHQSHILFFPIYYTRRPDMISVYSTGRDSRNTMHTLRSSYRSDLWSHLMCIAGIAHR